MAIQLKQLINIPSFPLGMDNRSWIDKLPKGAARLIQDADVTNQAVLISRPGIETISDASGGNSLYSHPGFPYALYNASGTLTGIHKQTKARPSIQAGISADQTLSYAYFAQRMYWCSRLEQGIVSKDGIAKLWGIDPPPAPILTASNTGTQLDAGRYIVAYTVTYNSTEESAASNLSLITLANAGTITVSPIPTHADIDYINLYISSTNAPDGDQLYYHSRVVNGTPSTIITKTELLRPLKNQDMARFPPCSFICTWKRHILGILGDEVIWSDPEKGGSIWDSKHARIKFANRPTFIAPVDDGVYVGTAIETYWLAGTDPMQWQKLRIAQHGIVPQQVTCWLPNDTFQGETPAIGPAVPWITTEGDIVIGRSQGVIQPIAPRLALPNHAESRFQFFEYDGIRRLLVLLEQPIGDNPRLSPDIVPINTYPYY